MKIYDALWKQEDKNGKVRWEKIGILIDRDGKLSLKINYIPVGSWDGWLVVKERTTGEEPF